MQSEHKLTEKEEKFILHLEKWYKDSSWGIYVMAGMIIVFISTGIFSIIKHNHDGMLISMYFGSLSFIGAVNMVSHRKLIRIIVKLRKSLKSHQE